MGKAKTAQQLVKDLRYAGNETLGEKDPALDKLVRDTLKTRPLSYSSLKNFAISPQHYIEYITAERKPDTDATKLGKLFDVLLLTPEEYEKRYRVFVKATGTGSMVINKATKDKAAEDKVALITQEDFDKALAMLKSIASNKDAMYYINRFKFAQNRIEWKNPQTGLKCIGYYDGESDIDDQDYFICDIKTAQDASEDKFIRDAHNFGYHLQTGGYTLAAKRRFFKYPDFIHVVIETKSPFAVNVFKASAKYLEQAQNEWEQTIIAFKHCLDNNLWHMSYEFHRLALPYNQMNLPGYFKPKFGGVEEI